MILEEQKIRFRIKSIDGIYSGEATGKELQHNSTFEVALSCGDSFFIRALKEKGLQCYKWICDTDKTKKLVNVIGKVIERHFNKFHPVE